MTQRFTIPGRLAGMNEYITANRSNAKAANRMKQEAQTSVMWAIKAARLRRAKSPVILRYLFVEPDRRRDLDNILSFATKVIQDALVKSEILPDDSQKHIKGFDVHFGTDKRNPRIEVEIEEVGV